MGRAKRNEKKLTSKSKQLIKDFEKKKRKKLGKKLKPANATEISFRSHSIYVTKQSLKDQNRALRKSVALISLDIRETLSHLSHHKAKVRRDVLIELKTILSRIKDNPLKFRNVLHINLVEIVSIFELIIDNEFIVRDALKVFINWFMPKCKNYIQLFAPFWTNIICHLTSALSHINISIRYNGLKILRSFFSVSSCSKYFNYNLLIKLLSHLQILWHDIIKSGNFILNNNDIKIITNLSNDKNKNPNQKQKQKQKTIKTNHAKTENIIHILCECSTHIIRAIHSQMHNSENTMENNLHSLLLPSDNYFNQILLIDNKNNNDEDMDLDDITIEYNNMMNDPSMFLLESLLSIFNSCCLILEQFGRKRNYSSMIMVSTQCNFIAECLNDESLKKLIKKYLNYKKNQLLIKKNNSNINENDLRLIICKSLMSLFGAFPTEYIAKIDRNDFKQNRNDDDDDNIDIKMDEKQENDKQNQEDINKMNVFRLNIKTMQICLIFIDFWKININLNTNKNKNKKMDYFKISYKWLIEAFKSISSENDANSKLLIDLLLILKQLIGHYDQRKQLELLLSVDQLLKNSAFVNDAKTIFAQFVN